MEKIEAYKVNNKIFENELDALQYEDQLKNIIDRSVKHDFVKGEVVYCCVRDKLLKCIVDREEEEIHIETIEELGMDVYVKNTYLILKIFNKSQIDSIKRDWRELLNFELPEI